MTATTAILDRLTEINSATLKQPLDTTNVVIESVGTLPGTVINTKGVLRPLPDGGFTGSITVGWRRLDLAKLFMAIPVVIHNPDAVTTRDLVPILNAMYGTEIDPVDILSASLPLKAANANVVMTANPASLYLVGSFTLRFTKA